MTGHVHRRPRLHELAADDLENGEIQFGLPAALLSCCSSSARRGGAGPAALALVAIIVALALTSLVGQAFELSFFIVNMVTGMGLALGIDYSLFVLSRYREERHGGPESMDAIVASGATASRAVLFSGSSFVVALCGLLLCRTRSCAAWRSGRSWSGS